MQNIESGACFAMESRQDHSCTDTAVPCTYSLHCLEGTPGESRGCSVIRMIAVKAVSLYPPYIACGGNPQQPGEDVVFGCMHQPASADKQDRLQA